jgi:transcription-repair coupling factor (superfamily II helicase)
VTLREISTRYKTLQLYDKAASLFGNPDIPNIHLKGLSGSSASVFCASITADFPGLHYILLGDREEAAYFYNDLLTCLPESNVTFFPSSFKRSIQFGQQDSGNIILRTNTLDKLRTYSSGLLIVVTYPEAISEKVLTRSELDRNTLLLSKGENISIEFIQEVLETYSFELVDFVTEPGQYAVRGSIVDIFSYSIEYPFRVDFFGDEVESIRSFDVESQLSKEMFEKVSIVPNIIDHNNDESVQSIFEFPISKPTLWSDCLEDTLIKLKDIADAILKEQKDKNIPLIYQSAQFRAHLEDIKSIEFGSASYLKSQSILTFNTRPQPHFQKNFKLLGDDLVSHITNGYETYILSDNEKQFERLRDIFRDTHHGSLFNSINQILHEGFIDDDLSICCYTDHQIFERYHKYQLHQYYSSKAAITLNELKDCVHIHPGF